MIATEESHGVMATAGVRDKDSACAALLLAEAALYQKRQGRTIPEYLDDLNRQFGYYRNELLNIVLTGLEGKLNMGRMLNMLRQNPPKRPSAASRWQVSRTCRTPRAGWGHSRATRTRPRGTS